MKNIASWGIPGLALVAVLAACSTAPVAPAHSSHTHTVPNVVSLGRAHFHADMEYDPKAGDITIRFYDETEKPYNAQVDARTKAKLIAPGQEPRDFYLRNRRAGASHYPSGKNVYWKYARTTHIDATETWLKGLSAFELKTWLPIDGIVYEATFIYPEPS